jgi:EpsI family protein
MPVYHGAVAEKGAYHKGSRELFLYVGYYPVQKQGSELIYYLNRISNEDIWKPQQIRGRLIGDGNRKVIEQVLKSDSGKQRLVWYWYRVGGLHTSSTYMAKGLQVLGLLTGKPHSAVIAVATDYGRDAGTARRTLAEFLSVMGPMLARGADGLSGE